MSNKPNLSFWKLWNLSFGFFGVQIAYALQSAQVSRIFSTIGADPHDLSYFWILPPLMGLIVQPIIGSLSDRTWNRFGRRLPYLLIGATIAIIVMCFLPNAGSIGLSLEPALFGLSPAIWFGLFMLMFLDTSINMAMQPFKMLVGDFVNEDQKSLAYSIQSSLCNAGSVVGYVAPILLGLFLAQTAPEGEVPPTVIWAFYLGAIILALCVIYTFVKVKEMPPREYAAYHGIQEKQVKEDEEAKKEGMFRLLVKAPKVFWTVGLVQFFCWSAFLYMWTYSTDAIAGHVYHTPATEVVNSITINGQSFEDNNLFQGQTPIVLNGIVYDKALNALNPEKPLIVAHSATNHDGEWIFVENQEIPGTSVDKIAFTTHTILNAASLEYQKSGDWYGVLLAIQAVAALIWAVVLSQFKSRKLGYSVSLLIGAVGFLSVYFFNTPGLLSISYALVGCGWAAMLAMPFTILTNALSGNHIGTYLGLFNCTICIPQIIAAICGGAILSLFPAMSNGAPNTVMMLFVAGILLAIGSCAVWNVKETFGSQQNN